MEKRALLAFALSMAVFVVWALFLTPKSKPPAQGRGAATQVESETGQALPKAEEAAQTAPEPEALRTKAQAVPEPRTDIREITVHTALYTAVFTEAGGLERTRWGTVVADEETGRTTKAGVWAGGDVVTGAATVISAMGAGKRAAADIDRYLKGEITVEGWA